MYSLAIPLCMYMKENKDLSHRLACTKELYDRLTGQIAVTAEILPHN